MYTILKSFADAVTFHPDAEKLIQVQVKYLSNKDFQHRICMQVLVIIMQMHFVTFSSSIFHLIIWSLMN